MLTSDAATHETQSLIEGPALPKAHPRPSPEDGPLVAETREIRRLRTALRRERARGRCGHWSYDLTRHLALAQALKRAEAASRRRATPTGCANTNARQADR